MKSYGAVRIRSKEPLQKAAYQIAIEKFKAGEYDMVFINKDHDMEVLDYGPSVTDWVSELFMKTPTASAANQ